MSASNPVARRDVPADLRRLLLINNYNYQRGGAETIFLEQADMFAAADWEVARLCMQHDRNQPSVWSDHFVDEIEFGKSYSLPQKMIRAAKVVYSFEAVRKARALAAQFRPSVVHAHNVYHHLSPAVLRAFHAMRTPVVLSVHDLKLACPAYKMLTHDGICERCRDGNLFNVVKNRCVKDSVVLSTVVWAESVLHRRLRTYAHYVDCFVVPSQFYATKLADWGFPVSRMAYVPNFVLARDPTHDRPPGRHVLYIGRLAAEKGLPTLVRAAATSKVPVRIAGEGVERPQLERLAKSLAAPVTFVGFVSGVALAAEIRGARAVVLPSEWYENAPLSVMEAYSHAIPAIGARIGGIPELIRDGETGYTFMSGDVNDLARVLTSMAAQTDDVIRAQGRAGWTWVARDFSRARHFERLEALYANLINSAHLGLAPLTA